MRAGQEGAHARHGGRAIGIAYIIASALAFGAMAILARVAYADGVDTATLLALRFTLAAACLAVIAGVRGVSLPRGRDLASVAMLGGAGYGGQAATFFTALTLAPAGLVALLLYLHSGTREVNHGDKPSAVTTRTFDGRIHEPVRER